MASSSGKITLYGGFQAISFPTDQFREATLSKGKDLLHAGHVQGVREEQEEGKVTIYAECLPETKVRQKPYQLEFQVNSVTRKVTDGRCSCPAGVTYNCKHSAGLFLLINSERSTGCTDDRPAWKRPSKKAQNLYPKGESLSGLFSFTPAQRPQFKPGKNHLNFALLPAETPQSSFPRHRRT